MLGSHKDGLHQSNAFFLSYSDAAFSVLHWIPWLSRSVRYPAPVSRGTDAIHTIASFLLRGLLVVDSQLLVHLYWYGDRLGHAPAQGHADQPEDAH